MYRFPKVSCICITYGRTNVLDESVYSFLIQDYPGEKELIILNDYEGLHIALEHKIENVKVINADNRYASLGEKRNACIKETTGDLICIWDDDDIFLSNRITSIVKKIGSRPYILPNKHIYYSNEIRLIPYGVKAQAVFYKSLWNEIGGYPLIDTGEDAKFEHNVRVSGKFRLVDIDVEEVAYLYRWRITNSYHVSSFQYEHSRKGPEDFVLKNVHETEYVIKPKWYEDYVSVADEAKRAYIQKA